MVGQIVVSLGAELEGAHLAEQVSGHATLTFGSEAHPQVLVVAPEEVPEALDKLSSRGLMLAVGARDEVAVPDDATVIDASVPEMRVYFDGRSVGAIAYDPAGIGNTNYDWWFGARGDGGARR